MSDGSTEEEIIKRRRFVKQKSLKKKGLENLFDEDNIHSDNESFEINADDNERSTIFNEIFGTGREYMYILEDTEERGENTEVEEESIVCDVSFDELCKFVSYNLDIETNKISFIIKMIQEGYNINYILLHTIDCDIDVYKAYEILECVCSFKYFSVRRNKLNKDSTISIDWDNVLSMEALKYVFRYKNFVPRSYEQIENLLTVHEFEENIKKKSKVYIPKNVSCNNIGYDEYFEHLSKSIHVRDFIIRLYILYGYIQNNELMIDEYILRNRIIELYISGNNDDPSEEFRFKIIRDVIESVLDENTKTYIVNRINSEKEKKEVFNFVFDRVFNGSIRRLKNDEVIISMTKDGKFYKGVVLNNLGNEKEKFSCTKSEIFDFVEKIQPSYICLGGFDPYIKNLMQEFINKSPLYVENQFYKEFIKDKYKFCHKIGRLALIPELEYISLYYNTSLSIFPSKELDRETCYEQIKRAILTSLSITGIDINFILQQPNKVEILNFLGLANNTKIFSNETYECIQDVKNVIESEIDYYNFCTYIRIFPEYSKLYYLLDCYPIHISNYEIGKELLHKCNVGFEIENIEVDGEEDNVSKLLPLFKELKSQLKCLNQNELIQMSNKYNKDVYRIYNSFLYNYRPIFKGFPDSVVFKDLTGIEEDIIGSVVEGKVHYVDETYCLCTIFRNTNVYVKIEKKVFLNQLVSIRILERNEPFISYAGELVEESSNKNVVFRYCKHPLFKDLNSRESEMYLKNNNELIVLRRSSKDSSPILVFRLYQDIFVHLKIELSDDSYKYRNNEFGTIDELISKVVKQILRNVKSITKHKYFYVNEEAANDHINKLSDYIKYGFFFSTEYPGKLCFLYNSKGLCKEHLTVSTSLLYRDKEFSDIESFIMFRKTFK